MSDWAIDKLQGLLDRELEGKDSVKVLEAGCGSLSHVTLPDDSHITGLDISQEQLDKNSCLHEKICGDIEEYQFGAASFDLIISWEVVEHLPRPTKALMNLKSALKENALLIVAAPNPTSMKGLLTRLTPHWFHVWVYRYIFSKKDAGQPGCAPFETIYDKGMYPEALKKYAAENDFDVVFFEKRDRFPRVFREERHLWFGLYKVCANILKVLSRGQLGGRENTDFIIVFRKKLPVSEVAGDVSSSQVATPVQT